MPAVEKLYLGALQAFSISSIIDFVLISSLAAVSYSYGRNLRAMIVKEDAFQQA